MWPVLFEFLDALNFMSEIMAHGQEVVHKKSDLRKKITFHFYVFVAVVVVVVFILKTCKVVVLQFELLSKEKVSFENKDNIFN